MTSKTSAAIAAAATFLLSACASSGAPRADPFEGLNRATFEFNDTVDRAVLEPVAKGYKAVTPDFFRAGVSNLFANIGDVAVSLNNLLQGKPGPAASDAGRFLVNSTLGILGLFDVATPMGLTKHEEDFGQTLGRWGLGSGPYLMVPFLGPSTLRDGSGRMVDTYAGYARQIDYVPVRYEAYALEVLQTRTNLLGAGKTLDEAALDKYQFLRDAYLQRRLRMVYDGKAPQEKLDQLEDDLMPPAPARTEPPGKTEKPDRK